MTRLLRILWLVVLLPGAALAQPVQVTSGEHDGFTRLVLDYGAVTDWQVGRTSDGYEVRLTESRPTYDLTGVYDLIGRGRLASVWVDPANGTLWIGIGCACHAQPFEFRPGIVVIDLKDGPPPKSSAFEVALNGEALRTFAPRPAPRPRARPDRPSLAGLPAGGISTYDWTDVLLGSGAQKGDTPVADRLPRTNPNLQPLRDVLVQQLIRGAAQGVIDMAHTKPTGDRLPQTDPVRVRLGDLPGVRVAGDADAPKGMTASGATCVADDRLDIGNWGDDRPVTEQMPEAMEGLMGEFDTPDPEAELRAVRFLLFICFGAEARQILTQIATGQPDATVLTSLAHILDDGPDLQPAFTGMSACDTAAAMWSLLGDPAPARGDALDRAAVLRTFSGLPVHLRRLLGPPLTDRFLALGDDAAAKSVRDAILRAPGDAGVDVALMEARMDLHAGDPSQAEQRLEPLITNAGPATAEALIAHVTTNLAKRTPVDPAQITALEALLHERKNTPDAARFAVALTQARALAGDFDQAFADLATVPEAARDVWALLAEIGPKSALLSHAVRPPGLFPTVAAPVAAQLARRLSDLGFAEPAATWLQQVPKADTDLAARVALQSKDARTALNLLAGTDDPELAPLRSQALTQLADEAALADMHAANGEEDARWRAVGRGRDWAQLAASGPQPWQPLAAVAIGAPPDAAEFPPPGDLAQGHALLQSSAETREQIEALLAATASPKKPPP